ncbi:hypothetical protein FS837_004494 [Tulasnella sp. UAMH 9824]|nr:hypothetical protein FS837_004494 [Tulasnella sp. UAMH 9824]
MERESLLQPTRELMFFETDPELPGQLQVPERPRAHGGGADIYQGTWISPRGQQLNVAVKELKDLIPNDRQTDPAALIRKRDTIFQAACGLEYLHAQTPPVCHADIKPENVLVNDLFRAVLSDFGLSRVLGGVGYHSGFTTSNTVKGTYNYTAPELFNDDNPRPTLNTDVYAFGGLILTVLSGKPPFYGLQQAVILRRVIKNQQPRQEDHRELSPSDPLWSLMRRCWNMIPGTRPPMQEVLREVSISMDSIKGSDSQV